LNGGLEAFVREIRDVQGVWDDVTLVITSEFGRTLAGNTGKNNITLDDFCFSKSYFD